MTWNLSPIAFRFSLGSLHWPVYWYGLFFAYTFVYGIFVLRCLYRQARRPPDDVYDLALALMGGTIIGARLGHVLFYDPVFYLTHPWKILAVWNGGLASHGAVIGVILAVWLYSRTKKDQSFLWVCDRIGLVSPLLGCLIRIGNFVNSEILGTPTDVPWAVIFARVDAIPRHPVQIYEAVCYLLIFLTQFGYFRKHRGDVAEGYLCGRFFVLVFGTRFMLEFFKEGQASFESGWPLTMGQWLSLPVVLAGAVLILRASRNERSRGARDRRNDERYWRHSAARLVESAETSGDGN